MNSMYDLIVIIDDDITNNMICENLLLNNQICKSTKSFESIESGLAFIKSISELKNFPNIIFLDLNFPRTSGWDYLQEFKDVITKSQGKTRLYILSSSISKSDIKKAQEEPMISGFMSKPLSKEKVLKLLE